jgi:hypothetical protein
VPAPISDEIRQQAVEIYHKTGSMKAVALELGINQESSVLYKWRNQDWFKDALNAKRLEESEVTDAALTEIVDSSLAGIKDRLSNGETQYDPKTGELIKVPVRLHDLNATLNTAVSRRQDLRMNPTGTQDVDTVNKQLQRLAQQFMKFASGKMDKSNDDDDAIDLVEQEDGSYAETDGQDMQEVSDVETVGSILPED